MDNIQREEFLQDLNRDFDRLRSHNAAWHDELYEREIWPLDDFAETRQRREKLESSGDSDKFFRG